MAAPLPPHFIKGTIQQRWNDAAKKAIRRAEKMSLEEIFEMVERNSGWIRPEEARKAMGLPHQA